jgi:hypothetical protein
VWEALRNTNPAFFLGGFLALAALLNSQSLWASWLCRLPGTIAHEIAHYVVALITGSRPTPISFRVRQTRGGWTMGEVEFRAGIFRAGWVALAPLYMLPPLAFGLWLEAQYLGHAYAVIAGYVAVMLLDGAIPSRQDWAIAIRYPIGTLFALGAITLVLATVLLGKG